MNKYQNRELQKIIVSLLGSSLLGVKAFLIITGVAVFFAWLPDGMSTLLDKIFGGEIFSWSTKDGTMLVQILGSVAIFLLVKQIIPKNVANVEININSEPKKAKALVLFLSPNKDEEEDLIKLKTLEDMKPFKYFMPFRAIDYHKDTLTKIIISCSDQSFNDKDKFLKCVQNIFGSKITKIIEIKNAGDFEKAKNVYDFLENAYEELKKEGFKEDDIVFDVTGGQKVIAIAGAMFAIPNDRHLQYVSTNDYSVRHYDLIYSQSEE